MYPTTKKSALRAIDGMREIVQREMLIQGEYVSDTIVNPKLAKVGAICGGRKHCAIGSLWAGYGIRPRTFSIGGGVILDGADESEREDFFNHRPGLKVAYDALNHAAERYAELHDIDMSHSGFNSTLEGLFEHHYGDEGDLTKRDLLRVISMAKRRVQAA